MSPTHHHELMRIALECAGQALPHDVPVGAVIAVEGEIIAKAYNRRELDNNPCGHAEILALEEAGKLLKNWRLNTATLYVTLEPCPMCAWTLYQARIGKIIFGAYDPLWGACGSKFNVFADKPDVEILGGTLEVECQTLLHHFFTQRRSHSDRFD